MLTFLCLKLSDNKHLQTCIFDKYKPYKKNKKMSIDWKLVLVIAIAILLASLVNKFIIEKGIEKFEEMNYDESEG